MRIMMELKDKIAETFSSLLSEAADILPQLVLGVVSVLVAWLLIKLILFVIKRILKAAKIDVLSQRVAEAKLFGDKEIKIDLLKITLATAKGLLILLFAMVFAEVMELQGVSNAIYALLGYLPALVSALLILVGGVYLATVVKNTVLKLMESMGIGGSKMVSGGLFYLIVFFVAITALNQAGVDTQIITSNFTMVLGAFLFALALGFGLGSKQVIAELLKMFYTRKKYMVGDKLVIEGLEGEVDSIDNLSITLRTKKGKVVLPIDEVVSKRVEIRE